MEYFDQNGNEIHEADGLSEQLDAITDYLSTLTREERIEWFKRTNTTVSIILT